MPELVIPDGFAQAQFIWNVTGNPRPAITTLGLAVADVPAVTDAEDLGELWMNSCAPNIASPTTLVQVKLIIGVAAGEPIIIEGAVGMPGSSSTAMASLDDAFLLKKQTGVGGRPHRGRMYQLGVAEGAVSAAGTLESGIAAAWNADLVTFLAALPATTSAVFTGAVVLHTFGVAPGPTAITSIICDARIANQRRRIGR